MTLSFTINCTSEFKMCVYLVNTVCVSVCMHGELKEYYTLGLIERVCSNMNCASKYKMSSVCVCVSSYHSMCERLCAWRVKEYYRLGLIESVCSNINCASECKMCVYLVNTVCVSVCVHGELKEYDGLGSNV